MKNLSLLLCSAVLALGAAGCDKPYVESITTPPPTKIAELDSADHTIDLSSGVALGFECTFKNAPCKAAKASVADANVARVMPAYLDYLSDQIYDQSSAELRGKKARSAFVVVGQSPGSTKLTLRVDDDGDEIAVDFEVSVEP